MGGIMELNHSTLHNGLPVAYLHNPEVKSLCLLVDVYSGSIHDQPGLEGEHHAFEHMPYRGCEKYPSKRDWAIPLEQVGIEAGRANTALDRTRFFLHAPSSKFSIAAEHLSQLVYRPLLKQADWELEQGPIIREYEQSRNDISSVYTEKLYPLLFPDMPSLQHPIIGTPASIQAITTDRMHAIHNMDYSVANSQIVVVGNLPGNCTQTLEATFGKLNLPAGTSEQNSTPLLVTSNGYHEVTNNVFNQPYFGTYQVFPCLNRRTKFALYLFNIMLGAEARMSSPIFRALREERDLVYSYSLANVVLFGGVLCLGFGANTPEAKITELQNRFWDVVDETLQDQDRFTIAKNFYIGNEELNIFSPSHEAMDAADQLLRWGQYLNDDQMLAEIKSLSFEEVQTTASQYYKRENFITLIGKN